MKENENEIGTEFSFKKGGGQGVVKLKLMRTKNHNGRLNPKRLEDWGAAKFRHESNDKN